VAAITDLSYTFFCLLSFYCYLGSENGGRNTPHLLPAVFFAIALLCKETAVMLPAIVVAYQFALPEPRNGAAQSWKRLAPYLIVIGIYMVVRYAALGSFAPVQMPGDMRGDQYLINAFPLFAVYVSKLLFPVGLNAFPTIHYIQTLFEPAEILAVTLVLAYLGAMYYAAKKSRSTFLGLLVILLPLLPTLYIPARGGSPLAERYLYLPSVGFAALLASSFIWLRGKTVRWRLAVAPAAVALVCVYAVQTFARTLVWKDNFVLYTDTIRKSPDAEMPRGNFGIALLEADRLDEAIEQFRIVIGQINPASQNAYYNLARAYKKKGMTADAIAAFEKAVSLDPGDGDARRALAALYARSGRPDDAAALCTEPSGNFQPDSAVVFAIGEDLEEMEFPEKAITCYRSGISPGRRYFPAHYRLGSALMRMGQTEEAIAQLSIASELQPENPYLRNMLGVLYGQKGRYDDAIAQFEQALRVLPAEPAFRSNLDRAIARKSDAATSN